MSKRPIPAAGAIVTAVLVLLFANPPFVDWINDPNNVNPDGVIGRLLRWLTWPAWEFWPGDMSTAQFISVEARAILIIALVFGILAWLAKGIGAGNVAFVVGWVAVILGAALASFIAYFIGAGNGSKFSTALDFLADGGTYGLFVGWIVGIGCMLAKRG